MMDITKCHTVAWRYGYTHFHYSGDPPHPVGMLVGEAPGPNTDARLPLYPAPTNSAAARLMKYAEIDPIDWMGKLVRVNMCDGPWSERRATAGRAKVISYLLNKENFHDGRPLRVLLLGARVAREWGCRGPFGRAVFFNAEEEPNLNVAWIPHPSGRNLLYNDRKNQLRARNAVLWAIGDRSKP